ncbi:MAG: glycosyltransferase, partial [Zhaonellaceae bacterium]
MPAYNEEKRLPKTLEKIHEYLREKEFDYEIIVVDDGSRDATV